MSCRLLSSWRASGPCAIGTLLASPSLCSSRVLLYTVGHLPWLHSEKPGNHLVYCDTCILPLDFSRHPFHLMVWASVLLPFCPSVLSAGPVWFCAKSLQSCPSLCDPVDCSPPGSSAHGILQARILERVDMPSSIGSSWPRDWTHSSCITGRFFTAEPLGKPQVLVLSHGISPSVCWPNTSINFCAKK